MLLNACSRTDVHRLVHWYTPLELAKRMGFYHSCQAVGSMMSSALQAAISSTLEGSSGLAGWRYKYPRSKITSLCSRDQPPANTWVDPKILDGYL